MSRLSRSAGGAGGFQSGTGLSVTPSTPYTIIVGAGGAGASTLASGSNGTNSGIYTSTSSLWSEGGGGGGTGTSSAANVKDRPDERAIIGRIQIAY